MRTTFPLNYDGSVTNYLVAEPKVEDFTAPFTLKDQLEFEKQMREIFYKEEAEFIESSPLGEISPLGTEWKYYSGVRNPYVDFSTFYFTLKNVEFCVRTILVSDKRRCVRARVWSYAAFDMWLSGKKVATEKVPVYQPIRYTDLTLELSRGENDLFFYIRNFGVRDTRNMLKLQILDTEGISVTLPIEDSLLSELKAAEEWLLSVRASGGKLVADSAPTADVTLTLDGKKESWGTSSYHDIGSAFRIDVNFSVHNQRFSRIIECVENRKLEYRKNKTDAPRRELAAALLEKYGYGKEPAKKLYDEKLGHAGMNLVIASAVLNGGISEYDEAIIDCALEYVLERRDCSDFELAGLLRLVLSFPLPDRVTEKIRKASLAFRYWMDEDGADAMCFWSENHALTFYTCQMLAGRIWENDIFLRSKRSGKEQYGVGKRRVYEWFDVVLAEGFEEFLAGGYMGVTVAALLTVYDFAEEDLKQKAKTLLDRIAVESATQCFKGVHIAPMGRVYRGVLTPYLSSVQGILHLISDECAEHVCPRVTNYLFSDYRFPEGLDKLAFGEVDTVFNSGRAEISTRKTRDTILTSAASPRSTPIVEIEDESTEYFRTKVMNESFHGTTLFVPGVGGYQQHMFYGAISEKFFTFVNLPGAERDFSGMRPGYWFGNLVFPKVKQVGRELYCRYIIPDSVPTPFTHAYFPMPIADEARENGNCKFARVGDSYIALFCSVPTVVNNENAVMNSEFRAYSRDTLWYVKVGSRSEDGDFDSFIDGVLKNINTESCLNALS